MRSIRVLVTGAGSGVGQGIIKALRIATVPVTVISADIAPLNAGLFRTDEALIMPKVESEGALESILSLLKDARIDVVMIGSEFDLEFFARHKRQIEADTGALVAASPPETVDISNDKWLTAEFLRSNGLPYARSHLPMGVEDALTTAHSWGYPLVLKTRTGTSNRHVHLIRSDSEMSILFPTVPKPMLQELIDEPSAALKAEYTCSIFKCADQTLLGPFTARRTLRGGSSWHVEVDKFLDLHSLLLAIGGKIPVMGSLNIQLMVGSRGPIPFEFNARFSGTTAVRAHFGFNEPDMFLRSYYLGEKVEQPLIRKGLALRYLEEVFIEGKSAADLLKELPRGEVRKWF